MSKIVYTAIAIVVILTIFALFALYNKFNTNIYAEETYTPNLITADSNEKS